MYAYEGVLCTWVIASTWVKVHVSLCPWRPTKDFRCLVPSLTPLVQGLSLTPEVHWWPRSLTECWGYSYWAVSVGSRNSRLQAVKPMLILTQHPCSLLR